MKTVALILSFALALAPTPCGAVKKRVALTFDDGPHIKFTKQILDVLDKYGVKATFFVVGENAERYPELVKSEYEAGHEIGNHTYSHRRLGSVDRAFMLDEIKKTDDIIYGITGKYPILFRPPEGRTSSELEADVFAKSKKTVLWTIDTRDWAHNPLADIVRTVKTNVKNGSIILFHDYITPYSETPDALEKLIPYLTENGYEFVTVSELLTNN